MPSRAPPVLALPQASLPPPLARPGRPSYIWTQSDRTGTPRMAMEAQDIEDLIRARFPEAKITITDLAGDGNHWAAEVIDESFRGLNRVQAQRMVYASLKGKMDGAHGELHALALTTKVPD
ncbi:stress-induced morphogen [Cereibacter johrii]|nr:stress-induced morphogen [Cereibacter johrii]